MITRMALAGGCLAFVEGRSGVSALRAESARFWHSGAIAVRPDGLWALDPYHEAVVVEDDPPPPKPETPKPRPRKPRVTPKPNPDGLE